MNDSIDPTGTGWCGVSFEADPPAIAVRERVRLADTDSSGLIYYGAVTPWLSRAHAELVLALGFRQTSLVPTPMLPVVNVEVTYHDRLALGDAYVLRGWVDRAGTSSVTMAYEIRRDDTLCVSARMTHVHLDEATMRPSPLPEALLAVARNRAGSGAAGGAAG